MRAPLKFLRHVAPLMATILVWMMGVSFSGAQTADFVALAPAPGGSQLGNLYGTRSLKDFFNTLFTIMIAVGAIIAVLRIAFAGYLYMATDMWHTKGKAKEIIGDVVLGLLLLLSIWLILRQINPQLLDLDILKNIPKTN